MRKLARLKCSSCSERLGKKEYGGHLVYADPLICPKCSTDNTQQIHDVIAEQKANEPAPEASAAVETDSKTERIPGTPLDNPKWESFCRIFALRKCSATRAYADAGFETGYEAARRSASELLTRHDVLARVSELQAELARKAVETEHWGREERIARLQSRATALDEIVAARALETENWQAAGGHTGHIVRTFKAAGGMVIDEFTVDIGLLKELRAIEQQIATELGEWLTKTAIDLRSNMPVFDVPADASIEQIREAKRKLQDAIDTFARPAAVESVQ